MRKGNLQEPIYLPYTCLRIDHQTVGDVGLGHDVVVSWLTVATWHTQSEIKCQLTYHILLTHNIILALSLVWRLHGWRDMDSHFLLSEF